MSIQRSGWLGFLLRFAKRHLAALIGLLIVGVLAAAVTAVQPLMLAPAVNAALPEGAGVDATKGLDLNTLGSQYLAWLGLERPWSGLRVIGLVLAGYMLVASLAAALNLGFYQLARWVRVTMAGEIQGAVFRHLLSLPLAFHRQQRLGAVTSRLTHDSMVTAQWFDVVIKGFVEAGVQVSIYGFLLVRTDALLALTVGLLGISHLGVTRLLQAHVRRRVAQELEATAGVGAQVSEALQGVRVIQSFGAAAFHADELAALFRRSRREAVWETLPANSEGPLRDLLNAAAVALAVIVSFAALMNGRLTVPGFVLFVVVARQVTVPMAHLATTLASLHAIRGASQRLLEILDVEPPVDGALETPALRTAIAFENVDFEYIPGVPVLRSVSLEIPRGSLVAIVGSSGAGKSTLLDLLLQLETPSAGRVTYDGSDIRLFSGDSYRRRFGVVPQETQLSSATIADNVRYGRVADETAVEQALSVAQALEFVSGLPGGVAASVGERGLNLSGGERQRIAIARAVYGKPDVLVFDEATSALDARSEALVQEAIDRVIAGRTAVIVAHRLSTVIRADRIVLLDQGRVVALGRHSELLETSALYRQLAREQLEKPAAESPAQTR